MPRNALIITDNLLIIDNQEYELNLKYSRYNTFKKVNAFIPKPWYGFKNQFEALKTINEYSDIITAIIYL